MDLKSPTLTERLAYVDCLRFQRRMLAERGAGRSGYLNPADTEAHRRAYAIVEGALDQGVGFDVELLTEELSRETA
jgi:hypothetical protein